MNNEEIMKKLQAPFDEKDIEWLEIKDKKDGKTYSCPFVTNRAIQRRLDDVCSVFGWKNEFVEWKNKSQLCGISILNDDGEWVTKWDGAEDSYMESTKGGLSGAMKRAAVQWGIGRYLYELPRVEAKPQQENAKKGNKALETSLKEKTK